MAHRRNTHAEAEYDLPVELAWKTLAGSGAGNIIDPLDEETYNNSVPKPGVVFTRLLEVVTNELFSFQLKTDVGTETWSVRFKPTGACKTRIIVDETVDFPDFRAFAACGFGTGLRREMRGFMKDIDKKLNDYEKDLKRKL